MDGPAEVSLFLYDNDTVVVESFRDGTAEVSLVLEGELNEVRDLETGELRAGKTVPEGRGWFRSPDAGKTVIPISVKPHSYRAFVRQRSGAGEKP
jgi:hypothetical protein